MEYAALKAEKRAAMTAASTPAPDAVTAPEAERQSGLPATAGPPAAAAEQPQPLRQRLLLAIRVGRRAFSENTYDDLKNEYEAGHEAGRQQAECYS